MKIGRGGDREIDVLSEMMSDTVVAVDPHRAHRTGTGLTLSVHQVIDDHRPIRPAEQFAQADTPNRRVACVEIRRSLLKDVVLDDGARRKATAHGRNPFAL